MGLETNNYTIYLSIGDGKITRRLKEPSKTSKQRTTKEGRVVNEEVYDAISGMLIDIKVTKHDKYGKFWNVYVKDGEDVFCLQMNYSSGYSSAFLKALPNVSLTEKVKIIPSMKIDNGKKKATIFINQHGKTMKHFYSKETPNDLPPMVKTRYKGEDVWDDTDMMLHLEKMVNEKILPQLVKGVEDVDVLLPANTDEDTELELEAEKVKPKLPF